MTGKISCMLLAAIALPALVSGFQKHHSKPHEVVINGVKIVDIKKGKGPKAKAGDNVTVDYTGKLTNGKVFDSSVGRAPFSFPLGGGQVIKGWDTGVVGMQVGGERKLTIPPSMGYGERGAGAAIPPNATLIFTIKMLKIGG